MPTQGEGIGGSDRSETGVRSHNAHMRRGAVRVKEARSRRRGSDLEEAEGWGLRETGSGRTMHILLLTGQEGVEPAQ